MSPRTDLRAMITGLRLLLGLKAAAAVLAAWLLGVLLPGTLDDYAYYAPLGALLGVAPTVFASIRSSVEMVIGIALGVLIGWGLISIGLPWFVRAPLAAGIGVIVAGARMLGEGRAYVAVAGLFVVILGADNPESYGLSYVVQFGLGLAVGTIVNIVFVPPLTFASARARISRLRHDVADRIDGLADVMIAEWPPDRDDWLDDSRQLRMAVDATRDLVDEARESGRANPRTLWRRADARNDYADVEALRQVGARVADIVDALSGAIWDRPVSVKIPPEAVDPLHDAFAAVADYLRAWDSGEHLDEARTRSRDAGRVAQQAFDRAEAESGLGTIVFALRTIQQSIDARVAPDEADA
ncbi:hypothetical protein PU630_05980 [Microbacterium horticulturae]|uniref:Aromatic acid exporter family member 1 n=1 Tax=Microbacterium horticulturae TaxID=3028316 RepID=A0ABY8C120_9MICO|nr:hypothetical protein [Microbacterium sp. KACC 23027]WEG10099.1 hypothetical protein PU630_05980 [Microbacterium sp. KACC 23027]